MSDRELIAKLIASNPAFLAEVRDEQQTWLAEHLADALASRPDGWRSLGAALVAHPGGSYGWPSIGGSHPRSAEYISLHGNDWHLPTIYTALLSAAPEGPET